MTDSIIALLQNGRASAEREASGSLPGLSGELPPLAVQLGTSRCHRLYLIQLGIRQVTADIRIIQADEPLTGSLAMASRIPADLIGRPDLGRIGVGLPAHPVIFAARSLNVLLSRNQADRIVLSHGRKVTDPLPLHHDLESALGIPVNEF